MQSVLHTVVHPEKEIHDLDGRVVIMLGGAVGIGFEISRAFVLNKARVIMVNHDEHGQYAIDKIKKETGEYSEIEWIPCNLGNLKEAKEILSNLRDREERLDLLICSADMDINQFGEDTDSIDRHFGINWLGQFYTCNLLYPLLRNTSQKADTPAPRIVWGSSQMHYNAPSGVHFASLDEINNSGRSSAELYGRSKLAIILGERVIQPNKDNIYALSVHPGTANAAMKQQCKDSVLDQCLIHLTMSAPWHSRAVRLSELGPAMST
ncbi:short-chain dehydrogenase [Apiospora arundinis]|uniref:Short-chain dehydrogenase n=1 Tax=Apiospora arundinis TaxID=335852 RepID=A0ABR2IXG5_9PEZI